MQTTGDGSAMCFSAQADLATGFAVGAIGVDALRHVSERRELPLVVPLCVLAVESDARRREVMTLCVGLGAGVAAVLLVGLVQGPVSAHDAGHRIAYVIGGSPGAVLAVLHVIATCGALLVSSSKAIAWFGVANLIAVTVLAVLTAGNVASLWCAWAAISSVAVALHLRNLHSEVHQTPAKAL